MPHLQMEDSPSCSQESNESHMLRPFRCELNVLSRPDGSAILTQGQTAVMVGVYGPVEVKLNRIIIEKAVVDAIYRPKSGLPSVSDKLCEDILQKTFDVAIIGIHYPRTCISIVAQEMQDSGGLLACLINAGCLALMNSGLAMKFLVAAVHCVINQEGDIILDPDNKQIQEPVANLTFAFDGVDKNVLTSHTSGRFTNIQYQEAMLKCRSASDEIFQFYRDIVKKYVPAMG